MVRCEVEASELVRFEDLAEAMISRRVLGTSMPTVGLPGMRSMRMDSAWRPRQRSSVSVVILAILTPASGLNSKVVTTGPGVDLDDVAEDVELLELGS